MRDDNRYQVALEWCGYTTQRYVVRFCGEYISNHFTRLDGEASCRRHHSKLMEEVHV